MLIATRKCLFLCFGFIHKDVYVFYIFVQHKHNIFSIFTNFFGVLMFSAGVGRTGTFIGLDILIDQAHDETKAAKIVDMMKCVHEMRQQRSNMIQTHVCSKYTTVIFKLFIDRCVKSGERTNKI